MYVPTNVKFNEKTYYFLLQFLSMELITDSWFTNFIRFKISLDFLNSLLDEVGSLQGSVSSQAIRSRTNEYFEADTVKSIYKSYNVRLLNYSQDDYSFSRTKTNPGFC